MTEYRGFTQYRPGFPFVDHRTLAEIAETVRLEALLWTKKISPQDLSVLTELQRKRKAALGTERDTSASNGNRL